MRFWPVFLLSLLLLVSFVSFLIDQYLKIYCFVSTILLLIVDLNRSQLSCYYIM